MLTFLSRPKPRNDAEKWMGDRLLEKTADLDKWLEIRRKRHWRPWKKHTGEVALDATRMDISLSKPIKRLIPWNI